MPIDPKKLKDLAKEIPFRWRIQSFSKYKPAGTCVAYIDARDAMDLLDKTVGPENWQTEYIEIRGQLFCKLSINVKDIGWVTKMDVGTESNTEAVKGSASDAFKRSAVHWGIGRFLYSMDLQYVKTNEKLEPGKYPYPVDYDGNRIYDLTAHINEQIKKRSK